MSASASVAKYSGPPPDHICPFCAKRLHSTVPFSPLLLQTDAGDSGMWASSSLPGYGQNHGQGQSDGQSDGSSSGGGWTTGDSADHQERREQEQEQGQEEEQGQEQGQEEEQAVIRRAFQPGGALHAFIVHARGTLRFPKVRSGR
jgi:hypothetical protein